MKHLVLAASAGITMMSFIVFLLYYSGSDLTERNISNAYFLLVAVIAGIKTGVIVNGKLEGRL